MLSSVPTQAERVAMKSEELCRRGARENRKDSDLGIFTDFPVKLLGLHTSKLCTLSSAIKKEEIEDGKHSDITGNAAVINTFSTALFIQKGLHIFCTCFCAFNVRVTHTRM